MAGPYFESHVLKYQGLTPAVQDVSAETTFGRTDVARGRPEEAGRLLLLEDVRRPAGHARAGEPRRCERRRDLGDVEDDRRVVLDIGGENTIRRALLQRRERRALELLRHLDVWRPELLRRPLQDA